MKINIRNIFFFFLGTLFFIGSFAQTRQEQIKVIRKKFEVINNDTSLKKVVLENEEFLEAMTDGGGELTGFYKGKEIKKIYEWIGLSNGISIKEFYFDNGQLIFVYEKFNSFIFDDKKNKFDYNETKTIFEGRYYFNRKLISKSTKGDKSLAAQDESTEKGLLERSSENLAMLNKKLIELFQF